MDINEVTGKRINRHPWELSRTKCLMDAFGVYLDKIHRKQESRIYMNIGAGDLYFDKRLLKKYRKDEVYAVDIGYQNSASKSRRIHKYHYLEEIEEKKFDYAMMMDSLEYMEDDVLYVRKVTERLKKGGYFFLTLPACPLLFSEHDINVKNLRRYNRKSFGALLRQVPELKKIEEYNFYTLLFAVRFWQKMLHLKIDPEHKVTTGWKFGERSIITKLVEGCLNLDFAVNKMLGKAGIHLPGLSMLVVCRKR